MLYQILTLFSQLLKKSYISHNDHIKLINEIIFVGICLCRGEGSLSSNTKAPLLGPVSTRWIQWATLMVADKGRGREN